MTSIPHPASFESLVALHRPDVLRVCRAIVREDDLSLDATQETFVRFWRRLGSTGAPDDTARWLRRTAVCVAIDFVRARSRRGRRTVELEVTAPSVAAHGAGPVETLMLAEFEQRFAEALAELPEGQRAVFLLRHDGQLSLAEVAKTLELSPTTVRTQFARAVLGLQSKLERFRQVEERR